MKHLSLALLILPMAPGLARAQAVSINTDGSSPAPSALLDVKSTDKGMLVPRMTTAQRSGIAAPATGLLVFDTNTGSFWFYNGTAWANLSGGGTPATFIADTDGNTKVQTEAAPNENVIRFSLDGTGKMVLQQNAAGAARLELPDGAHSTSIGQEAGANNVPVPGISGENNTFLGYRAGNSNTTGSGNTAGGASALSANTSGAYNTAAGFKALYANDTGNENTASGSFALTSNTTGGGNTAGGSNALLNNTSGSYNTALGANALLTATAADYNTALGYGTLNKNTDGNFNLAAGVYALENNTTGIANSALGPGALRKNTGGTGNVAVGQALTENTTGAFNVAAGSGALQSNTTGNHNIAIGRDALPFNLSGNANIAIGRTALYHATQDLEVVAIGDSALFHLNYPALGGEGSYNTAIGSRALFSETGAGSGNNTAVGYQSLYFNSIGRDNTAIGLQSLFSNTTGNYNTAMGEGLFFNTTGNWNTSTGYATLSSNTSGSYNTADGHGALYNTTTGSNNTAVGYIAMLSNTTGRWNTCIGEKSNTSAGNLDGATALGTSAVVNASNKVVIGANVGGMVIGGYANWSNLSDGRFKEDVRENVPGLTFITRLRPVTYWINTGKLQRHITAQMPDSVAARYLPDATRQSQDRMNIHTGFVAQEVEASARAIGYAFDGVNAPQNPTDNYSIAYGQFVPSLVKAMQEQQAEIEKLQKQVAENAALKAQVDAQAAQLQQITAALKSAGIEAEQGNK